MKGLDVTPPEHGPIFSKKAMCKIESIDLTGGYTAIRYSTWEAKTYWVLTFNGSIAFISESFDSVKTMVYTLRRQEFSPSTHEFLADEKPTNRQAAAEAFEKMNL